MARINNAITFGAGFNIAAQGPIDSRMRVEYESDLINSSTWPSASAPLYDGLTVTVMETGDIWVLKDVSNYQDKTNGTGWIKIGGGGGLTPDAGFNYATSYINDETGLEGKNIATGNYSNFAEGSRTKATSQYGGNHAEGYLSEATGSYACHAEGYYARATAECSHAEGSQTQAGGGASHAEGESTITSNFAEHAEGIQNVTHRASTSTIDGGNTRHSIGIGQWGTSDRKNAVEVMANGDMYLYGVGGYQGTDTKVQNASIMTIQDVVNAKQNTLTAGDNINIDASGVISAIGYIFDSSNGGFAEKYKQDAADGGLVVTNSATALGAHAEGYKTVASGDYGSHAEGNETTASGYCSHTEGDHNIASNTAAHAEGSHTTASGDVAHAEGDSTIASGNKSHAEGYKTVASGLFAHAEGQGGSNGSHVASGKGSHVEGNFNIAQNFGEHAEGAANISHQLVSTDEENFGSPGNTIHSIGIGRYTNSRKNAVEVMQNGDVYIYGTGSYQGTDTKVQNASIMTLQDVINSKADAYQTATTAEIEALFA